MLLAWHSYNYYPYERDLAEREIAALLAPSDVRQVSEGLEIRGELIQEELTREELIRKVASRITYFSGTVNDGELVPTTQALLEKSGRTGIKRQATRYSVHGLHEYKGKFNPQVVRALLNIFGVMPMQQVLDPFCGSGTTLVECAHLGIDATGTDINPLAVHITNTKIQALQTPVSTLEDLFRRLQSKLGCDKKWTLAPANDPRGKYLQSWFDPDVLAQIEGILMHVEDITAEASPIFLMIASNLLRDYSRQDPKDLRIRRRKSPLPVIPFVDAFLAAIPPFLERIRNAQEILGQRDSCCEALLHDITECRMSSRFDAAITSPPYAMALPYIDTQRLSLVWLGLLEPDRIPGLDAELIGSRELRGSARRDLHDQLTGNSEGLPDNQANLCLDLQNALTPDDGFRRQAVPGLLYRYFRAMQKSFQSVRAVMKSGAPYGLVVGHNHTNIGGVRRNIDTPLHLSRLAEFEGWSVEELIPLQTYRRYGYHVNNAVNSETLILLRNN